MATSLNTCGKRQYPAGGAGLAARRGARRAVRPLGCKFPPWEGAFNYGRGSIAVVMGQSGVLMETLPGPFLFHLLGLHRPSPASRRPPPIIARRPCRRRRRPLPPPVTAAATSFSALRPSADADPPLSGRFPFVFRLGLNPNCS